MTDDLSKLKNDSSGQLSEIIQYLAGSEDIVPTIAPVAGNVGGNAAAFAQAQNASNFISNSGNIAPTISLSRATLFAGSPASLSSDSLLEGNYSISQLLNATDNPLIWAIGIAVLQNILMKGSLEADQESINFFQSTSKATRQQMLDDNSKLLDHEQKLIKDQGNWYRSGTNPSGQIKQKPKKWWQKLLFFLGGVLLCMICPMIFGPLMAAAAVGSSIAMAIIAIIESAKGGANSALTKAKEIISSMSIVSNFFDAIFDTLDHVLERAGVSEKARAKLTFAKQIFMAVLTVAVIIASIIAMIMGSAAATGASGGAASPTVLAAIEGTIAAITAISSIISGCFTIVNGVRALRAAETKYDIDKLKNVIEAIKDHIQAVQEDINAVIEHMQGIIQNMNSNWETASNLIKNIGDTNIGIARAVSI